MLPESTSLPCACTALRKASRAISRIYDEAIAPAGMTTTQFAILRNLAGGGLALSRLAERLVMDRTSLYRTIAPVERRGWIAVAAGTHGRTRIATLTPAGAAAMRTATPHWEAAQARIVGTFGNADWAALAGSLTRITSIATGDET